MSPLRLGIYSTAMHSISTSVLRGRVLTATQLLHVSIMPAKCAQLKLGEGKKMSGEDETHVRQGLTSPQYCV